jgi:hypothetical protein
MHSLRSVYRGEALDEHVEHVVPVQHVDPDAPRVSSELLPAATHDIVAGEQLGAVLDALLLTSQPRERYRQARFDRRIQSFRHAEHLGMTMVNFQFIVTRASCHGLLGEVAVAGGLLRQAEGAGGSHGGAQDAPALLQAPQREVEEAGHRAAGPGPGRRDDLVGVGDDPEDLGGAHLRLLAYAGGAAVDEVDHIPGQFAVLHQRPPEERRKPPPSLLQMQPKLMLQLLLRTYPSLVPAWPVSLDTLKSMMSWAAGPVMGVYCGQ